MNQKNLLLGLVFLLVMITGCEKKNETIINSSNEFGGKTVESIYTKQQQANKSKEIFHYDNKNKVKKVERFFRLKFSKNIGFTRQVVFYNDKKKVLRDERFMTGSAQKKFGYKTLIYLFNNDGGKTEEEIHFTPQIIKQRGFTKFVVHIDPENGKKTSMERFNMKEREKRSGYYRWVTFYDEKGTAIREEKYDSKGNLVKKK